MGVCVWGAERELDESGQKIQTSSYQINKDQGCKVQHDDCSYGKFESWIDPKSSHHKEKTTTTILTLCEMMNVN